MKKGFVFVDELHGLVGEAVGEELIFGAVFESVDLVGGEIAGRGAFVGAGNVDVEALLGGAEFFAAEVPLADAGGGVAFGLEALGQGFFFKRELLGPLGDSETAVLWHVSGDPVGDVEAGGRLAGEQGGAGGGADGAGGVGLGEAHAVLGKLVDVGGLVVFGAVAAEVGPAHVVDEHDDDVWRRAGGQGRDDRDL